MDNLTNVLLVEDDEDDIFIISDRLETIANDTCNITVNTDIHEACNLLQTNQFDLCLLDYRLGEFTGIDLLERISQVEITTPIVLLTTLSEEQLGKQAITLGAQDYIAKSMIDKEIFIKSISYAISRKALEISKLNHQKIHNESLAKDKFISHLSHELRTPLTSILGYADLLLENPKAEAVSKELKIISNNGKHLLSLLNDVLDLSKLVAQKFEIQTAETDLRKLIVNVYSLVKLTANDKGLLLSVKASTELPSLVIVDETRLKQVLLNILTNAIKFTEQGHVELTIKCEAHASNPLLKFNIKDTGKGIADKDLVEIFKPFLQLEDVSTRKSGGAGLGLAISTEIIRRMGGDIAVSSEVDKGTRFVVSIPLLLGANSDYCAFDIHDDYLSSTKIQVPELKGHVLIVDDIFEIRQLVGAMVKNSGARLSVAKSGIQALEMYQQDAYDLIVMDLQMPGMTGQDVMTAIREQNPSQNVIAMTAGSIAKEKEQLIDIGFVDLLTKPISTKDFYAKLTHYLSSQIPQERIINDTIKVVLIEDDLDSGNILKLLIERLGCHVSLYTSFDEVEKNIGSYKDLECIIFTDLNLPNATPERLLSLIRDKHPNSHLAVISGQQVASAMLTEYKIEQNFMKPVSVPQLQAFISDVTGGT